MNTLKVIATSSHVYNVKENINVEDKLMESRPVNPERAIDQKLVEKAQKGDKKAFGMLVEKYQRRLNRLLSRMVRDQSEIEDIVQDSFIKAYRAINNFRGDSAFYTWLYRIAVNCAKNYLVAQGRKPPANDIDADDAEFYEGADSMRSNASPENLLLSEEVRAVIFNTIDSLCIRLN